MSLLLRRGIISSGRGGVFAVNSANLNGVDESFLYSGGVLSGTPSFSVGYRLKINSLSSDGALYTEASITQHASRFYSAIQTNGTFRFGIRDTDGGSFIDNYSVSTFNTGQWYHIILIVDSPNNSYKLYIDGSLSTVTNPTPVIGTIISGAYFADSRLGSTTSLLNYFDGSITDFNIWDRAISASDALSSYNGGIMQTYANMTTSLKVDLIGNWSLANSVPCLPVSSELVDKAFSSNNFTNPDSIPFTGTGLSVECNIFNVNSANLDGSTQYFTAGDVLDIGTSDFSCAFWYSGSGYVAAKEDSSISPFRLDVVGASTYI